MYAVSTVIVDRVLFKLVELVAEEFFRLLREIKEFSFSGRLYVREPYHSARRGWGFGQGLKMRDSDPCHHESRWSGVDVRDSGESRFLLLSAG